MPCGRRCQSMMRDSRMRSLIMLGQICSSSVLTRFLDANRYPLRSKTLRCGLIAIGSRRTQGALLHPKVGPPALLTPEILVQQAEQQMVLPDAVDAEIAPRQALARE